MDLDDLVRRYEDLNGGPQNCGGIFEGARLDEQLAEIEKITSSPTFWSNQAEAQKVMQRRRRVEDDLALRESLQAPRRRPRRAGRMGERRRGRRRRSRSAALDELQQEVEAAETQEDARRRARPRQRHRHHPSRRRRHRVAGLGRDAAADVLEVVRAPRLQARGHRLPARRRGGHQERDRARSPATTRTG